MEFIDITKSGMFDNEKHLTDEGIAYWVDEKASGNLKEFPAEILHHVDECPFCKSRILELEETLEYLGSDIISKNRHGFFIKGSIKRVLLYAAAAIFVIAPVTWILLRQHTSMGDGESLFLDNFQPYPDIMTVKGSANTDPEVIFLTGLAYYNQKAYDTAINFFNEIRSDFPRKDYADFYLAQSLMAGGRQMDEAVSILESLCQKAWVLKDESTWYLALGLIAMNKYQEASAYLDILISHSRAYQFKANDLRVELHKYVPVKK